MSTETNQTIATLIVMALGCLLGLIIVGILLCPMILLSVGWASGQSCDQPLDDFCKMTVILQLTSLGLKGLLEGQVRFRMYLPPPGPKMRRTVRDTPLNATTSSSGQRAVTCENASHQWTHRIHIICMHSQQ